MGKRLREKRFLNKEWLYVKRAHEPGVIMWENLNVSKFSRFLRTLFVALITIILIAATFYATIVSKNVRFSQLYSIMDPRLSVKKSAGKRSRKG